MIRKSEEVNDIVKPVYFPFTCASGDMIDLIREHLGSFIIYQPVAGNAPEPVNQAASADKIEVRTPVQGQEEAILEAARKSKNWGQTHQGHMDAFKATAGQEFYNESFVAEIRSEILGQKSRPPEADPVFTARLFLYLAQEFDIQQIELNNDLKASELDRKKMFSELKGDATTRLPPYEIYAAEDIGEYQTANRVLAWLRLPASEKESSPVYITTSRAVFEHLIEFVPHSEIVQTFDPLPADKAFQAAFRGYMAELVESSQPSGSVPLSMESFPTAGAGAGVVLTVAVLPVGSPAALLDRMASENPDTAAVSGSDGRMVVNLLETKKT
ncbi:MAG: hypothetical protein KGY61_11880 [Desulfobacterales bacterium]|nr:hypothetical protein [Desulfobacterales bacterium]